jgi:hypothetical protein
MTEQVDSSEGRDRADDGRESDEPEIMGIGDAVIDRKHVQIPRAGLPQLRGTLDIST